MKKQTIFECIKFLKNYKKLLKECFVSSILVTKTLSNQLLNFKWYLLIKSFNGNKDKENLTNFYYAKN